MKKVIKKLFLLILIPLALSHSLPLEANIITNKFKDIKDFFVSFKSTQAEYYKAKKEHNINILKQCSQEINALAKITDDLSKISPLLDLTLFGHLVNVKLITEEQLDVCIAERCKDSKEKMDQTWAQYSSKLKKFWGAIILFDVSLIVGTFATIKFGSIAQFYYKQYQEHQAERKREVEDAIAQRAYQANHEIEMRKLEAKRQAMRLKAQGAVEDIINYHGIANEPQINMIRDLLTDFMTAQCETDIPIPAHLELPIPVIAAIADAIHGRTRSNNIMNNTDSLGQFMRFLNHQQQLSRMSY